MKCVVFDFDGTICNDYLESIEVISQLSKTFRYQDPKQFELQDLRDLSARDILKKLQVGSWKLPFIVRAARKKLGLQIDNLQPFSGISEALNVLSNQGVKLGILTSNSKENVEFFCEKFALHFDFIHSGSSLFGKARIIKSLLRRLQIEPQDFAYVGDETRDIDAAKAAGVRGVAVSWGFNSKKALLKSDPWLLLDEPAMLENLVTCSPGQ